MARIYNINDSEEPRMKVVKGKNAQRIKEIAHRFDEDFSSAFKDMPLRAIIWTDAGNNNIIQIRVLASNEDGNFRAYNGYYDVNQEEFFAGNKMYKAFLNKAAFVKAEKAFLRFVSEITKIKYPVNKVMLDLNVLRYLTVKIGSSTVEDGSIDIHICTYIDQVKDSYGFVDARDVVGEDEYGRDLVSF